MADEAKIHSLEALESFRAALIIYQTRARRAVDSGIDEAKRVQRWVQQDQRLHWEQEIRKWDRVLERARAELMTVRMSALVDYTVMQREAVRKAERALSHAKEKLLFVKKWSRDMDTAMGPHLRRLESVREHYQHALPKATAWLHQAQITLADYADSRPSTSPPPPSAVPPADGGT